MSKLFSTDFYQDPLSGPFWPLELRPNGIPRQMNQFVWRNNLVLNQLQ